MQGPWVATSYGALNVKHLASAAETNLDYVLLPIRPAEPLGINGEVALLWERLVAGPIPDQELSVVQRDLVREFAEMGLASDDPNHPARILTVPSPWLVSPLHELVNSLLANLAREASAEIVFIKGPALHKQGLRDREHSGDVDAWVAFDGIQPLCELLVDWGWNILPTNRPPLSHSVTLRPGDWGCEIDLHYHFPGVEISGEQALALLKEQSETISFAGTPAIIPAKDLHAVIQALHLTRPALRRPHPPAVEMRTAEMLQNVGPITIDLSQQLQADAALAPVLTRAFPEEFTAPDRKAPRNWRWRGEPTLFQAYLMALRMVPAADLPRFLFRLVWPTAEFALISEKEAGGNARTPNSARYHRLRRLVRQVTSGRHSDGRPLA